eukprot:1137066-Pelagomonas_calceolata.AAC.4
MGLDAGQDVSQVGPEGGTESLGNPAEQVACTGGYILYERVRMGNGLWMLATRDKTWGSHSVLRHGLKTGLAASDSAAHPRINTASLMNEHTCIQEAGEYGKQQCSADVHPIVAAWQC